MSLIFYDFEVFRYDWLVVLADMTDKKVDVIVNDSGKLKDYYEKNSSEIWVGFNSRHYDQYILKGILLGMDPKEINDRIIVEDAPGWAISNAFNKIPLNNYDVMQNNDRGLKAFEGFMGNSIKESDVSFDIDRKLTDAEIAETVKYCTHDVEQTIEVFCERYADFEAQMGLISMFELPLRDISRTKVQLAAKILEASKQEYTDEFDISFPDTLRLSKYKCVKEWYENPEHRAYEYVTEKGTVRKMQLQLDVAGVPHVFGWGGVHGAREKYSSEGYFINMDVASLYPSLMIQYNLHSRSCNPAKFNEIVQTRLKYKREKNPLQAPLKLVINGTYGAMKDPHNPLYDPRQANNVCVYGQLLLLDLIEHLEPHCIIVQSNTDGVLVRMPDGENEDAFYDKIDDIAHEWETRTGLQLEFDEYSKVFQKDVNNYVIVGMDGKYKSKGAYVKRLSNLDYDMAIVNKAMIEYMVAGTPVEPTIFVCDDLKEFQQVKKVSTKYKYISHGEERLNERCIRCFASKNVKDQSLSKLHAKTGRVAKLEGTPKHTFLVNGDVNGVKCPAKLDKQWYVDVAKKRLIDFGVM